jgi:drug/metabolite transporter (DMT)-like permease
MAGMAVVLIKKLHDTDSSYAIFFAQCLFGMWIVLIPANLTPIAITVKTGLILLAIGVTAAIAQLLMTQAYRHVSVLLGSLLGMLVPVMNFTVGVLLFKEPFSLRSLGGALIIIVACIAVMVPDVKALRRETA